MADSCAVIKRYVDVVKISRNYSCTCNGNNESSARVKSTVGRAFANGNNNPSPRIMISPCRRCRQQRPGTFNVVHAAINWTGTGKNPSGFHLQRRVPRTGALRIICMILSSERTITNPTSCKRTGDTARDYRAERSRRACNT